MTAARQPCPSISAPPTTVPAAIPIETEVPNHENASATEPAAATRPIWP